MFYPISILIKIYRYLRSLLQLKDADLNPAMYVFNLQRGKHYSTVLIV